MTYTIGDMVLKDLNKNNFEKDREYIQGDIWIADLEKKALGHEQGGKRPVLIISKTKWNKSSQTPICVICTTSEKKGKNKYTVSIRENDSASFANASQIYTLDASRLIRRVDSVPLKKVKDLKRILNRLLWVN
jgi:mRNA-degrading endonuclease toxin of MazEF toxin-antitoxin module